MCSTRNQSLQVVFGVLSEANIFKFKCRMCWCGVNSSDTQQFAKGNGKKSAPYWVITHYQGIQTFFNENLFTYTLRGNVLVFCQFWFGTAKKIKHGYLLLQLQPALFQYLQALHQHNQDLITSMWIENKKTSFLLQESLFKKT